MKKERSEGFDEMLHGLKPLDSGPSFSAGFKEGLKTEEAKKAAETVMGRFVRITGMFLEFEVMPRLHIVATAAVVATIAIAGACAYYAKPSSLMVVSKEGIAVLKDASDVGRTNGLVKVDRAELIKALEDAGRRLSEDKDIPADLRSEMESSHRALLAMAASSKTQVCYFKSASRTKEEILKEATEKTLPAQLSPAMSPVPMTIAFTANSAPVGKTPVVSSKIDIGKPAVDLGRRLRYKSDNYLHVRELAGPEDLYPDIITMMLREKIRNQVLPGNIIEVRKDGTAKTSVIAHDTGNKTFTLEGFGPISEFEVIEAVSKDDAVMEDAFSYLGDDEIAALARLDADSDILISKAQDIITIIRKSRK